MRKKIIKLIKNLISAHELLSPEEFEKTYGIPRSFYVEIKIAQEGQQKQG